MVENLSIAFRAREDVRKTSRGHPYGRWETSRDELMLRAALGEEGPLAQLHLLPEEVLIKTGPVDHADWNFRPILGSIQRLRFHLVLKLLGERKVGRLLEIGYGSGVFMPELARRCRELHGIDVHEQSASVAQSLRKLDIDAKLVTGSAERMPFADGQFDAVVAVSAFEFIPDFERACAEISRVLRPSGECFIVTPGQSPLLDLGLKLLTGESAKADYGERRKQVMPALEKHFAIERIVSTPAFVNRVFCLYRGLELQKKRPS